MNANSSAGRMPNIQPAGRRNERSKQKKKTIEKCRSQIMAELCQLAFRSPNLKLFDRLKITELIKFKNE